MTMATANKAIGSADCAPFGLLAFRAEIGIAGSFSFMGRPTNHNDTRRSIVRSNKWVPATKWLGLGKPESGCTHDGDLRLHFSLVTNGAAH
jgi:hypothetical protein